MLAIDLHLYNVHTHAKCAGRMHIATKIVWMNEYKSIDWYLFVLFYGMATTTAKNKKKSKHSRELQYWKEKQKNKKITKGRNAVERWSGTRTAHGPVASFALYMCVYCVSSMYYSHIVLAYMHLACIHTSIYHAVVSIAKRRPTVWVSWSVDLAVVWQTRHREAQWAPHPPPPQTDYD